MWKDFRNKSEEYPLIFTIIGIGVAFFVVTFITYFFKSRAALTQARSLE